MESILYTQMVESGIQKHVSTEIETLFTFSCREKPDGTGQSVFQG